MGHNWLTPFPSGQYFSGFSDGDSGSSGSQHDLGRGGGALSGSLQGVALLVFCAGYSGAWYAIADFAVVMGAIFQAQRFQGWAKRFAQTPVPALCAAGRVGHGRNLSAGYSGGGN